MIELYECKVLAILWDKVVYDLVSFSPSDTQNALLSLKKVWGGGEEVVRRRKEIAISYGSANS